MLISQHMRQRLQWVKLVSHALLTLAPLTLLTPPPHQTPVLFAPTNQPPNKPTPQRESVVSRPSFAKGKLDDAVTEAFLHLEERMKEPDTRHELFCLRQGL